MTAGTAVGHVAETDVRERDPYVYDLRNPDTV